MGTRERNETKRECTVFSLLPFFFFFLIRHAIHVPSLQHPRFNLGEVEGWILEGPGLLCVRVSNSKNVSRVVEETSCRGGLSENWSEGCSSWKEKVRKKKNKRTGRAESFRARNALWAKLMARCTAGRVKRSPRDIAALFEPLVSGRGSSRSVSCGPEISLS